MNPFAEQHLDEIGCVLSCFDRVVITSTLPDICHPKAMAGYLSDPACWAFLSAKYATPLNCVFVGSGSLESRPSFPGGTLVPGYS